MDDQPAPYREYCSPTQNLTLHERVTIIRWNLGLVCQHQVCHNCGLTLSRTHGEQCSGARAMLEATVDPDLLTDRVPDNKSIINHLLNQARSNNPPPGLHKQLAKAIGRIFKFCRNMKQAPNGFWILKTAANDQHQIFQRNPVLTQEAPLTGNQSSNPTQTHNRRVIAVRRNRAVGRPSPYNRFRNHDNLGIPRSPTSPPAADGPSISRTRNRTRTGPAGIG